MDSIAKHTLHEDPTPLGVEYVRTPTMIGVSVTIACGCVAQAMMTLADFALLSDAGKAAVGYRLLVQAVNATEMEHDMRTRLVVKAALFIMIKSCCAAWEAHVAAWEGAHNGASPL